MSEIISMRELAQADLRAQHFKQVTSKRAFIPTTKRRAQKRR